MEKGTDTPDAITQPSKDVTEEEGVGHVMVEGSVEMAEEISERIEDEVVKAREEVPQPKVLDDEVAEVVRREEVKDQQPLIPSPPRAISPAPASNKPSRATSPKRDYNDGQDEDRPDYLDTPPLDTPDIPPTNGSSREPSVSKRPREDENGGEETSKRLRPTQTYSTPLPPALSHLRHPPTSTIFITNLRRPLLLSSLHEHVAPSAHPDNIFPPPRHPFASEDAPGLWLSGVKDHAYASYASIEEALDVAKRIENETWPEDTGAPLHVEFIPDDRVKALIEQEEAAWANGRQKLSLHIEQRGEGEWDFRLSGSGTIGAGPGTNGRPPPLPFGARPVDAGRPAFAPRPRGPVISGANAVHATGRAPINAPTRPTAMNRGGRGGFGGPPAGPRFHDNRGRGPSPPRQFSRGGPPPPRYAENGYDRSGPDRNHVRTTRTRPPLQWREGPGAARR